MASGLTGVWAILAGSLAVSPAFAVMTDCIIVPSGTYSIGAPVSGIIAEIAVDRGDWVEVGDLIARLDTTLQEMAIDSASARAAANEASLVSAQARVALMQGRLDRNRALRERNVVSNAVVEENEADLLVAENDLLTARENLTMARVEIEVARTERDRRMILSPASGYVVERALSRGEFLSESTPLATIADIGTLYVEAVIGIDAFGTIAIGEEALVEPEPPIGGSYLARVEVIDQVFDAASGTFGVRLSLPNPDRAVPAGLRCMVTFGS